MQRLERLLSREVTAWRLEQAGLTTAEARGLAELRVRVDAQRLSSAGDTASGRLNIVAATSGDTGSAAIAGGKAPVSTMA